MKHLVEFDELAKIFTSHGFNLYIIGGTSRDLLLDHTIDDLDFVSDASPEEIVSILDNCDKTYMKYGTIKHVLNGKKIDITSFRKEGEYDDSRHPSYIEFVKDINLDYIRRDFTINAIYINSNYEVIDPSNGLKDLENKIIRMIGDPLTRLKEDPLRIVRAYRFSILYGFEIEENLKKVISKNFNLLSKISSGKLDEEISKIKEHL